MSHPIFTKDQRSALEELEAVLDRRQQTGKLSLICANGVAHALYEGAAIRLEAALNADATEKYGQDYPGDDEENPTPAGG